MAKYPRRTESDRVAERGLRLVEAAVEDDLRWIFRRKRKSDVGIDAEIEIARDNEEATGALISVQVKCGHSYLAEKTGDGFVFRGDLAHLRYWIDHTLPVIVVLCDPDTGKCYWAEITPANVIRLGKSWKIIVPFDNQLNEDSRWKIEGLAKRVSIEDVVELAVIKWLHDKYPKRVEVCSWLPLPRDWNYSALLSEIDGCVTAVYPIYDRYGGFDTAEIDDAVTGLSAVERDFGVEKLIICLISQVRSAFTYSESVRSSLGAMRTNMEAVRFLFDQPFFLSEVDVDDRIISDYERGRPMYFSGSLFESA